MIANASTGGGGETSDETTALGFLGTQEFYLPYAAEINGEIIRGFRKDTGETYLDGDDEIVTTSILQGYLGGGDRYEIDGSVRSVVVKRPDGAPADASPSDYMTITEDGEELDPEGLVTWVESKAQIDQFVADGQLPEPPSGGLFDLIPGLLPGIGPLNSSQTTAAAILLALTIAGTLMR